VDAQARIHSLQQQCQALEHEKLQLEHRISTQGAHAARVVADAAVAAAAAAMPAAGGQHMIGSSTLHSLGLAGAHGHGGISARLPPPGFDPVPMHHHHAQQQQQPLQQPLQPQLPLPGTPSAASGSAAAAGAAAAVQQADLGSVVPQDQQGVDLEKNEHQLVLAFLSCLRTDPSQATKYSDFDPMAVNVQLMPLTWDENYEYKYGSMHKFMSDRPMVFGVRDDGAFFKYHNSEQLVQQKLAQEAEAAAAAAAAPTAGPAAQATSAAHDSSSQAVFAPPQPQLQAATNQQQQQHGPPSGGWHSQFQPPQQHVSGPMLGPGQHSLHSGPPSGHGMNMHAMSMPMVQHAGMGGVSMHHSSGPVPPHVGSMGVVSMGMPYYPHPMMSHSMPTSMPLAAPSMPFPSGPHREQQGW